MKRGLFAVGSLTFYMLVDFAVISVSIMGSYKVYRLFERLQQAGMHSLGIGDKKGC